MSNVLAGFDSEFFPAHRSTMFWLKTNTNLSWCGYYLDAPSQGLDTGWLGERAYLESLGWKIAPIFVGQQDPNYNGGNLSYSPSSAQGVIDGDEAVLQMSNSTSLETVYDQNTSSYIEVTSGQGFAAGTPVYLDIEYGEIATAADAQNDEAYILSWCQTVQNAGYTPGIYCPYTDATTIANLLAANGVTAKFWVADPNWQLYDPTEFVVGPTTFPTPDPSVYSAKYTGSGYSGATAWQYETGYQIQTVNGDYSIDLDVSTAWSSPPTEPVVVTEVPPGVSTGDLDAGKQLAIALAMSGPVTVTGAPTLALNDGGTAAYNAAYSTSTSLVFVYTVATGQNVAALTVDGVALPGGAAITDGSGNAANLSGAVATFGGIEVDTSAPTIPVDAPLHFQAGATQTITSALLSASDNFSSGAQLVYTVTKQPTNGVLLLNGTSTTTFTQADINAGNVSYRETVKGATSDSFFFAVTDAAGNVTGSTPFEIQLSGPPTLGGIYTSNVQVTTATLDPAPVQIQNGAALQIQSGGTLTVVSGGSIDNSDNELNDAIDVASGGTLAINAATTIDIGILNNSGQILASPGADQKTTIITGWHNDGDPGRRFINNGTVHLQTGTLEIYQGGSSNASEFSVDAGAAVLFTGAYAFTFTGGTYNIAGATEIGDSAYFGVLNFSQGTTVELANDWVINGSVDMSAATLRRRPETGESGCAFY